LIRLARATGARRGEILAMRWSDVDWSANKTRIESLYRVKKQIGIKPTKTRQAREISIPPSLVDYLRLHKEWQQNDRDLFGPDYRTDLDLIFADQLETILIPQVYRARPFDSRERPVSKISAFILFGTATHRSCFTTECP